MIPTKEHLINNLIEEIKESIRQLHISLESARQAAIDAPGKMESRYDTAKEENSRLADSIMLQITNQEQDFRLLSEFRSFLLKREGVDKIETGSLAHIVMDGEEKILFIVPGGSGRIVTLDGQNITSVSPASPIVRAILGHKKGDLVEFRIGNDLKKIEILKIG